MVMKRFFPKQPDFFKILSQMADLTLKVSQEFEGFLNPSLPPEQVAKSIADLEHEADDYVARSIKVLADTFITPIERDDLHALFVATDSVIDLYHAASQRFHAYRMKTVSAETAEMIRLTHSCVVEFHELILKLKDFKSPEPLEKISAKIHQLEKQADRKMRSSLASLYESNVDVAQIFKERDLIIVLEKISDQIKDVARLIEAIVLEKT